MLSPIKSNIGRKLTDKGYRQRFFKGRAEDQIAFELRKFRKERGLRQSELAALCGMKQSAISRIEQASYSKWNFSTLWRIADALDVRVRVIIDDASNAIKEYEKLEDFGAHSYTHTFVSNQSVFQNNWAGKRPRHSNAAVFVGTVTLSNEYATNLTAGVITVTGGSAHGEETGTYVQSLH
jgi:transcriptional regulator with XRE-family HTH domain